MCGCHLCHTVSWLPWPQTPGVSMICKKLPYISGMLNFLFAHKNEITTQILSEIHYKGIFYRENWRLFNIFISQHHNCVLLTHSIFCTSSSRWFPGEDTLLYPQLHVGKSYIKSNMGFCVSHSKSVALWQWSSAVEEGVIHSYPSKA